MSSGDTFENVVFPKGGPNKIALVERDGYTVVRIFLGEGDKIPPHIANHSAFFLVLKGRAIISSGDEVVERGEHQFIAMEANQMRGIHALEDSVILGVRD